LPSSQASPAVVFGMPSPQTRGVQSVSHVVDSPAASHDSPADGLVVPSPQAAAVQSASHVGEAPAVSHSSLPVVMPLPQAVTVQFESQPSPLTALPSSQSSPGAASLPQPPTCSAVVVAVDVVVVAGFARRRSACSADRHGHRDCSLPTPDHAPSPANG
jgi:hypothetical protein